MLSSAFFAYVRHFEVDAFFAFLVMFFASVGGVGGWAESRWGHLIRKHGVRMYEYCVIMYLA